MSKGINQKGAGPSLNLHESSTPSFLQGTYHCGETTAVLRARAKRSSVFPRAGTCHVHKPADQTAQTFPATDRVVNRTVHSVPPESSYLVAEFGPWVWSVANEPHFLHGAQNLGIYWRSSPTKHTVTQKLLCLAALLNGVPCWMCSGTHQWVTRPPSR